MLQQFSMSRDHDRTVSERAWADRRSASQASGAPQDGRKTTVQCRGNTDDDVSAWSSEASNLKTPIQIPSQVVLAGIETHVCVQQTALELQERGFQVFVAADCVGSRFPEDQQWGLHRMADAGVIITTAEAIAFEWCGRAGHERFKALSRIIRERDMQRKRIDQIRKPSPRQKKAQTSDWSGFCLDAPTQVLY